MSVEVRLLGPLEVECAGRSLLIGAPKERLILVLLVLNSGRVVALERLVDVIWEGHPPRSAAVSVRVLVSRLRKTLAEAGCGDAIRTRPPGYVLASDAVASDVHHFEALAAHGRAQLAAGEAKAAATLREALALWRGEELAEAGTEGLAGESARLAEARLATLEARIDADLRVGGHAQLVGELEELCRRHPLREVFWGQRMLALYRCGRQADALAAYQQLRTTLAEELGLDPGPELRRVEGAVLAQEPSLDWLRASTSKASDELLPPRQLRSPSQTFAGRTAELARLDTLLSTSEAGDGSGVLCVLTGTAGVGKTSLALFWGHRVAPRFPDGQLFINLRGFDPSGTVVDPGEALRDFLSALGVPAHRIPVGLEAQAALYRTVLAEKRVLIVLDNARDADQVRPLLPGSPGTAVIVTSRDQLTGLVATEGAFHLTVDVPTPVEAHDILVSRLGSERVSAEPEAVNAVLESCALLPLALAVAAARASISPELTMRALAAELSHRGRRLDRLTAGDPASDVRSVLSWSYTALTTDAAELFRLLGLHPGPDVSAAAAASLSGWPLERTRLVLIQLRRAHLIMEYRPERYVLHDLLHAYALEEAARSDSDECRHLALLRLVDHYVHTAHDSAQLLRPAQSPVSLTAPRAGVTVEPILDQDAALAWFSAEHPLLITAIVHAADAGLDASAYQLARDFSDYLERRGHWHDQATIWRTALTAAGRLGDRSMQARAHRYLASAFTYLDSLDDAETSLQRSLELSRQDADRVGQAHSHLDLGWLSDRRGDYREALGHAQQALNLYSSARHARGRANALNAMGWFTAELGDHHSALTLDQQALALHQAHDDRDGEADDWDNLGYSHHHLGHYPAAIDCYRKAIGMYRKLSVRYDEAVALVGLGDTFQAARDRQAAHDAWQDALAIFAELGHPHAKEVRLKLRSLS